MQRRQFFEVAVALPIVAACKSEQPEPPPSPPPPFVALRNFVVPANVEPALTFVPLKQR
jgi:hypothetical protein